MINKTKFNSYRKVQMSGKYNMITDTIKAMKAANISYEEYLYCIANYNQLTNKYGKY